MKKTLFTDNTNVKIPFAEIFRPAEINQVAGQKHLLGSSASFRLALESASLGSFILWGPAGTGKTTLALIVANYIDEYFVRFSAVTGGVKDVRKIVAEASLRQQSGQGTMLFVDEIHRFNRAQQDAFLPHVEDGTIRIVGATTENPSFYLNSPLLSRTTVFVLKPLQENELITMGQRIVADLRFKKYYEKEINSAVLGVIAKAADGDARRFINTLEQLVGIAAGKTITPEFTSEMIQTAPLAYDNSGEEHYNLISALHKSLRSSDPDASLYWFARMIESGENPLYIGRRLIRFATEDIGLADPSALTISMRAVDAYRFIGSPEGDLALAEAVIYLAIAPKSNSVYSAWKKAVKTVQAAGSLPVPLHLRNAPTALMKNLNYGKNYQYAHSKEGVVTHKNFPDKMNEELFYIPLCSGRETSISNLLKKWKNERDAARKKEREGNGR